MPFRPAFQIVVFFAGVTGLCLMSTLRAAAADASQVIRAAILWEKTDVAGSVSIERGALASLANGVGPVSENVFRLSPDARGRLLLEVTPESAANNPSGLPTLVTVAVENGRGFTFRAQDGSADFPVFLPHDGVVVTVAADPRSYPEIVSAIRQRGGQTKLQRIAAAPEMDFPTAAATGRVVKAETWLGVTRDIRTFRIDPAMETFQPRFAGYDTPLPETPRQPATYALHYGRGWGVRDALVRRLDDGVLPILRGALEEESVHYDVTMFASLERGPLRADAIRGTDYLVADAHGHGHSFTPAQAEAQKLRREIELNTDEEIVLYARVVATNRGRAPQFALLHAAVPNLATPTSPKLPAWTFDPATGFGTYASGRVFAIGILDGAPLRAQENSVLLPPGASVTLDVAVPHRPISAERAAALAKQSFAARLEEARTFWRTKLESAAQWQLPEPRLQQMTRAGLLHLDLIAYGRPAPAPLLPAVGIYTAIGSESAPIIQAMDAFGWHDQAARALDFFLAKQHDNGFMQNFNGYMLETGAVLWTMGEHFRYTRDLAWLRRVQPGLTKACDYLLAWRERNLRPELRGHGYGLLDGKTADPEDPYRSFMLNGYAYLGLARAAEMVQSIAPADAARYRTGAEALKQNIITALAHALERSPVVPLGDGTWTRAAPPWTGYRGPVMLHADGGEWFTHGSSVVRDSLLGPLHLVFQEVLRAAEPMAEELLTTHSELMTRDNVAFSQPYYSRHPWIHLQRGETKPFLAAWYGAVAALADRETFTFSEHFFPASAHKTHEEAWFLMETRWMLYLERGDTLRLLGGVPRAYLRPGATVGVKAAASYFGPLTFSVTTAADGQSVRVIVECPGERRPRTVEVRVPHPAGRPASGTTAGNYNADTETLRFEMFDGHAEATVRF